MTVAAHDDKPTYEQFKEQWLSSIANADLSPFHKGLQFATKLVTEWLDITDDDDDFHVTDGAGDGGIDIACLRRSDIDDTESETSEGDTWYIVQSKYGAAFSGAQTIRSEAGKVLATLSGENSNLSQASQQIVEKINTFRQQASSTDRIVLVFATVDPVQQQDRRSLDDVKLIGRQRIGKLFDVQELSLMTIWESLDDADPPKLSVPIKGQFIDQYSGFLVGAVSLVDLFDFLQSFRSQTGYFDQLYEKNVRQFLGGRNKINKKIAETLADNPEKFGLYNNGITIVTSSFRKSGDDVIILNDPCIVNGCQTTRTIWQVLDRQLNAGGTGSDPIIERWKERAKQGGVVTKIVQSGDADVTNITRYTNSQNAVREKDFVTLETHFKTWARQMGEEYNIFLEVQRGSTDARKSYKQQHPGKPAFGAYTNAFELIKVYGAGWLAEPGMAFNKNAPFLPPIGAIYKRIMDRPDGVPPFGVSDLYAAYLVKREADNIGFGRKTNQGSRRLSRFLFYFVFIQMLIDVIRLTQQIREGNIPANVITDAILKLAVPEANEGREKLSKASVGVIDAYLTPGSDQSVQKEECFDSEFNGDLNAFLKADNLGKENHSPLLLQLLAMHNAAFGVNDSRELVASAIRQS